MASPLEDPLSHSMDSDEFHFMGGVVKNTYAWSKSWVGGLDWLGLDGLSKFMFLELVAFLIVIAIFVPYAVAVRRRGYAKGVWENTLESLLLFIRDRVAIPAIGEHDANTFLPFLWTLFLFILTNNLIGMLPNLGAPTAALGCTAALATWSFIVIHGGGMLKLGVGGYAHAFVPHVPWFLYPLLLGIEIVGAIIKPIILSVRLFVNILAGHTVMYVIVGFIAVVGWGGLYFIVMPASVMGAAALSVLELLVALIQAFVFTFLSAIFIGAAVHPHH